MTAQDPFRAAEAQFRLLNHQRATGQIDEATYRNALNALRVQDAQGRWWMMQEGTGTWFVYQGNQWVQASPYPPAPQSSAAPPPPPQTAYAAPAPQGATGKSMGGAVIKYTVIILIIFGLIGAGLAIFVQDFQPVMLLGVAAAAAFSWILTVKSLSEQWEGQIVDIRMERVRVRGDEDEPDTWENVRFAYVRQPNGKVKKIRAGKGWQVGDYLRKSRGDTMVRKVN